jgi:hypothetical protein
MRFRKSQLPAIVNDAANMGIAKIQAYETYLSTFIFQFSCTDYIKAQAKQLLKDEAKNLCVDI